MPAMAFTPNPPVTNSETAIENFRQLAVKSFTDALERAYETRPNNPDDKTLALWEGRISKAKAQMASALQQLIQADVMFSEMKARESYGTLVALIKNTYSALNNLMTSTGGTPAEQQARSQLITAHAALLQSLASIAPLALWPKGQSGGATG